MVSPLSALEGLGAYRVIAPRGLTDTGRIRRFQTRTVSKLVEQAVRFRDDLSATLYQVIQASYTEHEDLNTGQSMADTTKAVLGRTTRDSLEVDVVTGSAHAVYLTAAAQGGSPGVGHVEEAHSGYMIFFWAHPTDGKPPGIRRFKRVAWRPHNIPEGDDPIANLLSDYTKRFQDVMIATHGTALVEFVDANNAEMAEVA